MNEFDKDYLSFTLEEPNELNELPFLDTLAFIDSKNVIQLKFYQKPNKPDVYTNFSEAVAPKQHKTGAVAGEIFRRAYTNTTERGLDESLSNLQNIFENNSYPSRLVIKKINEIQNNNFTPSSKKSEREKDIQTHPGRNYTISLPFTAFRCEKIGRKLIKLIKNITPDYKLNIAWETIKLSSKIKTYPNLKFKKPFDSKVNVVYEFKCDCDSSYIGETKQRLDERIKQHNIGGTQATAIKKHTINCPKFNDNLLNYFNTHKPINACIKMDKKGPSIIANYQLTLKLRSHFLKTHFKIAGSNYRYYHRRVINESIYIKVKQPTINIQNLKPKIKVKKKIDFSNKEPVTLKLI